MCGKGGEFLTDREAKLLEDLDHNIAILSADLSDARNHRRRIMAKARNRQRYRENYGLGSNKPDGSQIRL